MKTETVLFLCQITAVEAGSSTLTATFGHLMKTSEMGDFNVSFDLLGEDKTFDESNAVFWTVK